jgi:hypothetical protein
LLPNGTTADNGELWPVSFSRLLDGGPPLAFLAPCRESRVITAMEEQSTTKFVGVEHGPTSARDRVQFIFSLEGKLNPRKTVARDDSIVDVGLHAKEGELAEVIVFEGQVCFYDLVEVALFPEFGLDDSPGSEKRPSQRHHRRRRLTARG